MRRSWPGHVVLHVDLDAFFAQAEELDDPSLRGRAVFVGGSRRVDGRERPRGEPWPPPSRGVVATANYEAREAGVRSAMPLSEAWRRRPDAIAVPCRFGRYKELSELVFAVCGEWTPIVERTGIDEGYLDATGLERWVATEARRAVGDVARAAASVLPEGASPTDPDVIDEHWPAMLAAGLRLAVRERTELSCSVGAGPNRFLAKIASDYRKPGGVTAVSAADAERFVASLPIEKLRGVGPATARRLAERGYRTGSDIARAPRDAIARTLGDLGAALWDAAHGLAPAGSDAGPVVGVARERKSISHETTFSQDVADPDALAETLTLLTAKAAWKLRTLGLRAGCVSVKLRDHRFETHGRDRSLADRAAGGVGFSDLDRDLLAVALELLRELHASGTFAGRPIRLVGVKLSKLTAGGHRQLNLGEADGGYERASAAARAADAVRARHGFGAIRPASAASTPRRPAPPFGADRRPPSGR